MVDQAPNSVRRCDISVTSVTAAKSAIPCPSECPGAVKYSFRARSVDESEPTKRTRPNIVSIRCSPQDSAGSCAQAAAALIAGFWLAFQFHGRSSAICLAG